MASARGVAEHAPSPTGRRVWLFDLDDTLHDASHAAFGPLREAMAAYMVDELGLDPAEAARLRTHYWRRYGATLLGLIRHHDVDTAHFLAETHRHPGLEALLRTSPHDRAALGRLRGRKFVLTNAPRAYALRVLRKLRLERFFEGVLSIEDMRLFGELRPKPDGRLFRHVAARLRVRPSDCVLVEDMLDNQKTAHAIGMRTVWMQRYLQGRYRGHPAPAAPPRPAGHGRVGPGTPRGCPNPRYVYAKIKTLQQLLTLR